MKIIILTDLLPYPLKSGGAQAVFNMINCLRKDHDITFIVPETGNNRPTNMRTLQAMWPEVYIKMFPYWRQLLYWKFIKDKAIRAFRILFTPKSRKLLVERTLLPYGIYFSKDFKNYLRNIIEDVKPDIFQSEFYPCMDVVETIKRHQNIKTVFIHHELRFVRNDRLLNNIPLTSSESRLKENVKKHEISLLCQYDRVVVFSDIDKKALIDNGVKTTIAVSPVGINTASNSFTEWNGTLSYLGGYGHIPNKEGMDWFSNKVLPILNKDLTKNIQIIGGGWPEEYKNKYGFDLKGFVPALAPVLEGTILIIPLLTGSGMRMKLLEASALSIPFVTTSVGVEGLSFQHEIDCLVADTPAEFAEAIKRITNDRELRKRLAEHAHQTYLNNYTIEKLAEIRNSIYQDLFKS